MESLNGELFVRKGNRRLFVLKKLHQYMSDTLGSRFNFAFAMTTTVRVSILAGFSLGDLRPQLRSLAPVLLPTTDVAAVLISLIINYTIN